MGALLVPLGVPLRRVAGAPSPRGRAGDAPGEGARDDVAAEIADLGAEDEPGGDTGEAPAFALPFARRDLERLRLVLLAQRRLREAHGPASARRAMAAKSYFEDAVRWLAIHGGEEGRELAAQWWGLGAGPAEPIADEGAGAPPEDAAAGDGEAPRRRRRRRRRRRPPAKPADPA
jgi:poly(A) polymerase